MHGGSGALSSSPSLGVGVCNAGHIVHLCLPYQCNYALYFPLQTLKPLSPPRGAWRRLRCEQDESPNSLLSALFLSRHVSLFFLFRIFRWEYRLLSACFDFLHAMVKKNKKKVNGRESNTVRYGIVTSLSLAC